MKKFISVYWTAVTVLAVISIGVFLISANMDSTDASTVTVSASVTPTVTCSTDNNSTSFGTLTSSAVATSTPNASSTMSCNYGTGCTLSVVDVGNTTNGGLATTSPAYLIPSPASGFPSTAALNAGTEGYGIQATTTATGSGGALGINSIYNSYGTGTVGKLTVATQTLASSTASISNREVVVKHKAAVSGTTQAASYTDTITYSCAGN